MSTQSLEERRLSAAQDLLRGAKQAAIVKNYGVSRTTASRWSRTLQARGSLKSTPKTGRPRKVSFEQVHAIWERNPGCTVAMLTKLIERELGVHYDPDHVARLRMRMRGEGVKR